MSRDVALRSAWIHYKRGFAPALIGEPTTDFRVAFCRGWDARQCPNLQPVIDWLEAGCDPAEAAKELRIYQEAKP